ncbi:transposase IS4, partial [Thermosipho africanus Ob7]
MYLANIQSTRRLYAYLLDEKIKINNLPFRQTIHYRKDYQKKYETK